MDKLIKSIFGKDIQEVCEELVIDGKVVVVEGLGAVISPSKAMNPVLDSPVNIDHRYLTVDSTAGANLFELIKEMAPRCG